MTAQLQPPEDTPPAPFSGASPAGSPRRIGGREHARQYAAAMPQTGPARFVDGAGQPQPDAADDPDFEEGEATVVAGPSGSGSAAPPPPGVNGPPFDGNDGERDRPKPNGGDPEPKWGGRATSASFPSAPPAAFPEPEDRGLAVLSDLGETEYVDDLIRPGRIVVVGAEEGAGKSFSIDSELGIRVAVAGGSFAGTWEISQTGPVCYLSEMHSDDDFYRETTVLDSLHLARAALTGKYYRLALMTAAGGRPCLTVPEWRTRFTSWACEHHALLAIFDTATGATQVDPWGREIQAVFASLRAMIEAYPALAIVLLVHLKKPTGRGARRLSDVLGEWGRWCDVVMLLEADGFTRTKITVRKRVRHERRIVATKSGGLLVDPVDLAEAPGTKVPLDKVLAAIVEQPGIGYLALGKALGVSKDTAANYVKALGEVVSVRTGPNRQVLVYPGAEVPNGADRASSVPVGRLEGGERGPGAEVPNDSIEFGTRSSAPTASDPVQVALDIFGEDLRLSGHDDDPDRDAAAGREGSQS